jgi:SAM-dependent methyltransferase
MPSIPPVTAAAEVQRRLWGTNPRAWADLAEAHNQPLFEAVLDAAQVSPGTRLLDVGCGSGLTLMLAAQRGARPSGLDVSPGLLDVARGRLPGADLREGDMEFLPFGDAAFDAVTGVNAFQFAGDPQKALREAARVTRPDGRVVASLFAALRNHGRRRPSPAVLRRWRAGHRSRRREESPRRPAACLGAVQGPADRRHYLGEHVPVGRGGPEGGRALSRTSRPIVAVDSGLAVESVAPSTTKQPRSPDPPR